MAAQFAKANKSAIPTIFRIMSLSFFLSANNWRNLRRLPNRRSRHKFPL
jgi:hypothetical protein